MRFNSPITLGELAGKLELSYVGASEHVVSGLNEIHRVEEGDLVFVDHPKYYNKALLSAATTILINKDVVCPDGKGLLISEDPFRDYNTIARMFLPPAFQKARMGEDVWVSPDAQIHSTAVIGSRSRVGAGTIIKAGVVIGDDVVIGENCIIHPNAVIGGDAFYYKKRPSGYEKMYTCGGIEIGDDVEIGALSSVDRGVSATTRIGAGSKLDNLVHVGHDTLIGEHCLFAAQVGIAGCVQIGNNVTLWGQVGVPSDITIGDGAVVLGQSGVSKDIEGGKTYFGSPASEAREKFKELALIRKIPQIIEKLG